MEGVRQSPGATVHAESISRAGEIRGKCGANPRVQKPDQIRVAVRDDLVAGEGELVILRRRLEQQAQRDRDDDGRDWPEEEDGEEHGLGHITQRGIFLDRLFPEPFASVGEVGRRVIRVPAIRPKAPRGLDPVIVLVAKPNFEPSIPKARTTAVDLFCVERSHYVREVALAGAWSHGGAHAAFAWSRG